MIPGGSNAWFSNSGNVNLVANDGSIGGNGGGGATFRAMSERNLLHDNGGLFDMSGDGKSDQSISKKTIAKKMEMTKVLRTEESLSVDNKLYSPDCVWLVLNLYRKTRIAVNDFCLISELAKIDPFKTYVAIVGNSNADSNDFFQQSAFSHLPKNTVSVTMFVNERLSPFFHYVNQLFGVPAKLCMEKILKLLTVEFTILNVGNEDSLTINSVKIDFKELPPFVNVSEMGATKFCDKQYKFVNTIKDMEILKILDGLTDDNQKVFYKLPTNETAVAASVPQDILSCVVRGNTSIQKIPQIQSQMA